MITDAHIENALSKELEGKVFEHVWVTNSGSTFFCAKDYYTVKQGKVYFIAKDGMLQASEDTLLSLKSESRCIGKYQEGKVYKSTHNTMTQSEIKKSLKL